MNDTTLAIVLALLALIAGPAGAVINSWLNRRKQAATISTQITVAAGNLIGEYRSLAAELRAELEVQAKAIENLTGQVLKYRLALVITVMQLRMAGFEPMIEPDKIDTMTVEELQLLAEGASNAEARRQRGKDL